MSAAKAKGRNLWKLLPGLLISAFFLWRTLRGIHYETFRSMHLQSPVWIAVMAAFLLAGYTVRIYRWWFMMRRSSAPSFGVCGRVLLTSFAANNVLPFRIGDFLRVFAYAPDLGASSSTILSTVILERLLDIMCLLALLAIALVGSGSLLATLHVSMHLIVVLLSAVSLAVLIMLFGAAPLEKMVRALVRRMPAGAFVARLENWLLLAFDAVKSMTFADKLFLMVTSFAAWLCEGMIFVSAAKILGLTSGPRGPWLALSLSNLSYLIPSSPGAIGTFEYFCKIAMTSQGARADIAAVFGLLVHVVVLFAITAAGGVAFLLHRIHRKDRRPLLQEIEDLPAELPQH